MRNRIAAWIGVAFLTLWAVPGSTGASAAWAAAGSLESGAPGAAPASGVPRFSHVIIIVFENQEFPDVVGNPIMPNFNRLAGKSALLTAYYAVTHPSLPNYLALVSGDFFGIQDDCTDCTVNAGSLPDLLEASGRSWRAYVEGLPSPGFTGDLFGRYSKKHNPFVYFDSIRKDPVRLERSVLPFDRLSADLESGVLPDFSFIVPDMCNSAHDCGPDVADAWIGKVAGMILGSPAFTSDSLLVLTFDEGTTNLGCCGSPAAAGGGRIATLLISPLVKPGYRDKTPYSHYSLLKTVLASWRLGELGRTSDPAVVPILKPWRNRTHSAPEGPP